MREREQIMLCYPFEERRLQKWLKESNYVYLQPKYEGDRCRAVIDAAGRVTMFSSSARVIESVPHIKRALESLNLTGVEFDGELYKHGMPHEEIRSRVSRTTGPHPQHEEIEYHIYDLISQHEQVTRRNHLHVLLPEEHPILVIAPTFLGSTEDEIKAQYEQFVNVGYEGIILRHLRGKYKRSRSTDIMKLKPRLSGIYEVVTQLEEYSIHGEPKGTLGALILKDPDGNTFKVGSGFTRGQREDYWKLNLRGRWVKIRYQSITLNGDGVPKMASFESFVQSEASETE
jgi:DNA ligase-1